MLKSWTGKLLVAAIICIAKANAISAAFEILATSSEVRDIIGEYQGYAVMAKDLDNRDRLVVLRLPDLTYYEIDASDIAKAVNIRISPDGQWVAHNAYRNPERIIVRSLAEGANIHYDVGEGYYPHWWKDPTSDKLYLVWSSANENDIVATYDGETYRREIINGQLIGDRETIFNEGYKAGLSKNGRWLGTASLSVFLYDIHNQQKHAITTGNSTCWPRMNPATDPARMDQICFINTDHDTLITKNSSDEIVWQMPFPENAFGPFDASKNKWHSNGWSNVEDVMLTGVYSDYLTPGTKKYYMVLVRRSDKKFCVLAEAGPHQDMWFANAPNYSTVSAAHKSQPLLIKQHSAAAIGISIVHSNQGVKSAVFDLQGKMLNSAIQKQKTSAPVIYINKLRQ